MRISDWSSDVCSSDLEGKDEVAEDEVHHRPHEGADEVPEGDIELRLEAPGDGDEKLRRHHADDDEDHEVDGEGELAGLEALVPAQCQRQQADSDVDVPDPRSEEHTSELQSLMRISYAVFCLKKKKH